MNNLRTSPPKFLQKPSPYFFMVHLLHRLYGVDAPDGRRTHGSKAAAARGGRIEQTDRRTHADGRTDGRTPDSCIDPAPHRPTMQAVPINYDLRTTITKHGASERGRPAITWSFLPRFDSESSADRRWRRT